MSAVDEFTNMAEGGFILDSDYEMLQYNALLEIIERIKALEDVAHTPSEKEIGKPALDLKALIEKYTNFIEDVAEGEIQDTVPNLLSAFAGELGVG